MKPTRMVEPPANRGPLLTDAEVAKLLKLDDPEGHNARRWVRTHVPKKRKLTHNTLRWFERDVLEWVESQGVA
jgi:predicted DNA-binding transcriptional regulator AlpA